MTKKTDHPSSAVRIRVMKRDKFRCTYCGTPGTDAELEIDHIIAVSKGGSHHMSNLTTACRSCNQKKSNGTLEGTYNGDNKVNTPYRNGLVGFFVHTYKDGQLNYQGHIVSVDGETALVQLFSFLDGCPTKVIPIHKSVIYSDTCELYATNDDMLNAYQKMVDRKDYRHPGWQQKEMEVTA